MHQESQPDKLFKEDEEFLSTFAQHHQQFDPLIEEKEQTKNLQEIDSPNSNFEQFSLSKGQQQFEDKFPNSSYGLMFEFEEEDSIFSKIQQTPEPKKNQQFLNVFISPKRLNSRPSQVKADKNCGTMKHLMKKVIQGILSKKYSQLFRSDPQIKAEIKSMVETELYQYKSQKNHNNNLQSMRKIFGQSPSSSNPKNRSFLMRKATQQMIMQSIIPQILANAQIPNKKLYIYSFLMQSHRCHNPELMERTQQL